MLTARTAGLTRHALAHRLERGRWQRVLPGVYVSHSGQLTRDEAVAAAMVYAGPAAVLSGTYALHRHRVRSAPEVAGRILVLVPTGSCRPSRGPVHVRPSILLPACPVLRDGIAVAPVPRAVVDTCLGLRSRATVRAITAEVVQRRLCTVGDLGAELSRSARRGSALLRAAIAEVGLGAWSAPECEAGALLRGSGVPAFEQNIDVYRADGDWLACGDVVWPHLRALLEVDSREHHADPDAWERTLARHNRLSTAGWAVLHYSPGQIRAAGPALPDQVLAWLVGRAAELGVPLHPSPAPPG